MRKRSELSGAANPPNDVLKYNAIVQSRSGMATQGNHDKFHLGKKLYIPVNTNVATMVPNDTILVRNRMLFLSHPKHTSFTHRDIMYIIFTIENGRFLTIAYSSSSAARISQVKA